MIKPTLLASGIALLVAGCGGEDGGGSSAPTTPYYKVSFVNLASSSSSDSSCLIYDYDDVNNPTSKVIGYAARPDSGYSIVIHNQDGSVASTYTSADWGTATSYRFKQSDVPTNGYVSFVSRVYSASRYSYEIVSYAKSVLPSSFSVYSGGSNAGGCITGKNTTIKERTGYISQPDSGDYYFGFNTIIQDLDDVTANYAQLGLNNAAGISFYAPSNRSVIAIQYSRSGSDIGNVLAYKLTDLSSIGTLSSAVELNDVDYDDATWSIPTDGTTLTSANIHIYNTKSGAVLWQPLETTSDNTYSYAAALGSSNYYLNLEGSYKDWDIAYVASMTSASSGVDMTSTISGLDIPAQQDVEIASCSSAASGSCYVVNSSSSAHNDITMRLQAYNNVSSIGNVSQVIYSGYQTQVPVLSFEDTVDDIWAGSELTYELSLLKKSGTVLDKPFLYNQQDLTALLDNEASTFSDPLPMLQSYASRLSNQNLFKYTPHILLQASSD